MIRLTALLRRNPALSHEEFDNHWRDTHAELISSVPGIRDWVVRYEQHPRLVQPGGWTGSEGFDGMTVQWFRSHEDLMAMIQDPAYRHRVSPDELRLLDLEGSAFLLTTEPRVIIDD
jgi:uncharacterized protein (TIGR02118 family)